MYDCMKTVKIPKVCAAFCAAELAGFEAICESNRTHERTRAGRNRDFNLNLIRPN